MPAVGPLAQKIGLIIHLGYTRHKGGEILQAGKERLAAEQKRKLLALLKGGPAENAPFAERSCFENPESLRKQGPYVLTRDWGVTRRPWCHLPNVKRYLGLLIVAMAPEVTRKRKCRCLGPSVSFGAATKILRRTTEWGGISQ